MVLKGTILSLETTVQGGFVENQVVYKIIRDFVTSVRYNLILG